MNKNLKQILKTLIKKVDIFCQYIKDKPLLLLISLGFLLLILFWLFSDDEQEIIEDNYAQNIEFSEAQDLDGVKESVDPRDMWVAKVDEKIATTNQNLSEELKQKNFDRQQEISDLKNEITDLKESLQLMEEQWLAEKNKLPPLGRALEEDRMQQKQRKEITLAKKFRHISSNHKKLNKDLEYYIPAGSFARGVLMTGAVVGTGTNSASNPEPIMIRLSHEGIFSKGGKLKNIKDAILIGSCVGEMNSERAKCRLQTLSLKDKNDNIIEKKVNGWLVGEDGRIGVKGIVVDKSSDVVRMALVSGMLGGMSKFMENQATKQTFPAGMYPMSPAATMQQNALSASDSIKGGMYSGASNAFEKLADFAIKRADQLSPVIVISSGREVDVLFSKGLSLLDDENNLPASINYNGANSNNLENNSFQGGNRYQQNYNEVIRQINQEDLINANQAKPESLSDGEF